MTASKQEFSWKSRSVGDAESQLNWMMIAMVDAIEAFDRLVGQSHKMLETRIEGDAEQALRERARAMRVPARYDDRLIDSFRQEPGATEWHLLNAFTRMATHANLPLDAARLIMDASGQWIDGFDLVSARLPRPVAMRIGARITSDGDSDDE
jgi:hypothetical protein